MNMGMTPAAEGPAPMYSAPGPDQQPLDLEGSLTMVESIIFRDGGMDQNEQRVFSAWVQKIIMRAQATQAPGGQPDPGLGQSSASSYSDANTMGGSGSSPMEPASTSY